jgi:hypothetical protein
LVAFDDSSSQAASVVNCCLDKDGQAEDVRIDLDVGHRNRERFELSRGFGRGAPTMAASFY